MVINGEQSEPVRRKSVIPQSDEIILPNGKARTDPSVFHVPGSDNPTEFLDAVRTEHTDDVPQPELAYGTPAHHAQVADVAPSGGPPRSGFWSQLPVWVWVTIAVGIVALVVTLILLSTRSDGPAVALSPSPSPTVSPSPSPSGEPVSAFGLLDDGIAEDEYPAAVASRPQGLPPAHVMEPWVWDRVGPAWTVVSVAPQAEWEGDSVGSEAVVDLVSPEGVHFELVRVPLSRDRQALRVVTWHEDDRAARVETYRAGAGDGHEGFLLDLESGQLEQTAFTFPSGPSVTEQYLTSTSDGVELWTARGAEYDHQRLYRWVPGTGWSRVQPQTDYYVDTWTEQRSVSPDGSSVLLTIHTSDASRFASARSGPPGFATYLIYSPSSDTTREVRPQYPAGVEWCYPSGWASNSVIRQECYDGDVSTAWGFDTNGRWVTSPESYPPVMGQSASVVDTVSGLTLVGESGAIEVFEFVHEAPDGPVSVLTAGAQLPRSGVRFFGSREIAPDVYRILTARGSYLIDTKNGVGAAVLTDVDSSKVVGVAGYREANASFSSFGY